MPIHTASRRSPTPRNLGQKSACPNWLSQKKSLKFTDKLSANNLSWLSQANYPPGKNTRKLGIFKPRVDTPIIPPVKILESGYFYRERTLLFLRLDKRIRIPRKYKVIP